MCPHILRYLTTAVIINKQNRRTMLKDLVKVIQQVQIVLPFLGSGRFINFFTKKNRNRTPIVIRLQSLLNICT